MEKLRRLWRSRTMTFGVPLLVVVTGEAQSILNEGQFYRGLECQDRDGAFHFLFDVQIDPALKEKLKQSTVTLGSEYEKLEKSKLDNWENIRGPSLWEDSRMVQKQRREALRLKTE